MALSMLGSLPSAANAIAIAPSNVQAATTVAALAGPGAVCAFAVVNGVTDPAAGAANTGMCSDMAMIGPVGKKVPIINTADTKKIGNAFMQNGGAAAGRGLLYNVMSSNDKADAASNGGGVATLTTSADVGKPPLPPFAKSTATQTLAAGPPAGINGTATANTAVPPAPAVNNAFAVGIVDDPVDFGIIGPNTFGTVSVTIGNGSQGLLLQATDPGDFAEVFYEIGTSTSGTLLSFGISIDSSTTSLQPSNFTFDSFNPAIGYATADDFLTDVLMPALSFNPSLHQLTGAPSIPVLQFSLPADGSPITLTDNYGAITGSVAGPEPATLFLTMFVLALGVVFKNKVCPYRSRRTAGAGPLI